MARRAAYVALSKHGGCSALSPRAWPEFAADRVIVLWYAGWDRHTLGMIIDQPA